MVAVFPYTIKTFNKTRSHKLYGKCAFRKRMPLSMGSGIIWKPCYGRESCICIKGGYYILRFVREWLFSVKWQRKLFERFFYIYRAICWQRLWNPRIKHNALHNDIKDFEYMLTIIWKHTCNLIFVFILKDFILWVKKTTSQCSVQWTNKPIIQRIIIVTIIFHTTQVWSETKFFQVLLNKFLKI